MPRATCRCGQVLSVPAVGPDRVICPKCSARVRVRRDSPGEGDGFLRFNCPCGRRLKVRAGADDVTQLSGKCPDCGRIVPVPASSSASDVELKIKGLGPESRTEELDAADLAALDRWTETHLGAPPPPPPPVVAPEDPALAETGALPAVSAAPAVKVEAGMRVCPRCGRPLHLSAVACRNCGAPAPKR